MRLPSGEVTVMVISRPGINRTWSPFAGSPSWSVGPISTEAPGWVGVAVRVAMLPCGMVSLA